MKLESLLRAMRESGAAPELIEETRARLKRDAAKRGKSGGRARASNLTPEQRSEIARLGGKAKALAARHEKA